MVPSKYIHRHHTRIGLLVIVKLGSDNIARIIAEYLITCTTVCHTMVPYNIHDMNDVRSLIKERVATVTGGYTDADEYHRQPGRLSRVNSVRRSSKT